jgi:hypothetical protein
MYETNRRLVTRRERQSKRPDSPPSRREVGSGLLAPLEDEVWDRQDSGRAD